MPSGCGRSKGIPRMSSVDQVPCRLGWPHDVLGAAQLRSLYAAAFFSAGTRRSSDNTRSAGTGGFSASSSGDDGRGGGAPARAWASAFADADAAASAAAIWIAVCLMDIDTLRRDERRFGVVEPTERESSNGGIASATGRARLHRARPLRYRSPVSRAERSRGLAPPAARSGTRAATRRAAPVARPSSQCAPADCRRRK